MPEEVHALRIKILENYRLPTGRDPRHRMAVKFFIGKGYIDSIMEPFISYRRRILTTDLIWAAENVDRRYMPLIPAAVARFPGHFEHRDLWPPDLREAIESFAATEPGPDFRGVPFMEYSRWLHFQPFDRRSREPGRQVRVVLPPALVERARRYATLRKLSRTQVLQRALERLLQGEG